MGANLRTRHMHTTVLVQSQKPQTKRSGRPEEGKSNDWQTSAVYRRAVPFWAHKTASHIFESREEESSHAAAVGRHRRVGGKQRPMKGRDTHPDFFPFHRQYGVTLLNLHTIRSTDGATQPKLLLAKSLS